MPPRSDLPYCARCFVIRDRACAKKPDWAKFALIFGNQRRRLVVYVDYETSPRSCFARRLTRSLRDSV